MPYYQTPTCYSYSVEKKRALIELAAKYDFYIIEDDNQSDFNYYNETITPLKALDYKNRVIYIKSFTKLLMPGLRLGFMVLPPAVLARVANAKFTADIETSGFIQRAFSLFIENSGFYKHIERMKEVFKKRYLTMAMASKKYMGKKLDYIEPKGGLCFWYNLPTNIPAKDFTERLYKNGVAATPGDVFLLNETPHGEPETNGIRLSFTNVNETEIIEGIKKIANELK